MFETTALYYDKYGRVVQSRATNHLLGYDLVYNELKFTGAPARTYKTHGINGASATITELYTYDYDKAQRLTTTKYSLNGGSLGTLASNTYDELGRLSTKTLGGIDATTYNYNIRSWTTDIVGSHFSENLYYNVNAANVPVFTPCYNGNIAGMQWTVASENLNYTRTYNFVYDELNRFTSSIYFRKMGSRFSNVGRYDEAFSYDKMGNVNSLLRYEASRLITDLSFAYTGNQLKKVDHNPGTPYIPYGSEAFNDKQKIDIEYNYDKNGSTTWDVNTGISLIQYNVLNLPDQIQFTEGHKNMYTYDASGRKLEAVNYTVHNIVNVPINTISTLPSNPSDYTKLTTDYVGNMIYENGVLKEILLPEGYYQGGVYYYYLKDHLGNNRLVINSSGAVIEKSHYYPSGMRFYPESTSNSAALSYRYNGKEMEAMNGLNQMDYGARRRGAGLPIWTAVDPLAEKYYSISPYAYCAGNPVNRIDPDGREIWIAFNVTDQDGNTSQQKVQFKNGGLYGTDGKAYTGKSDYATKVLGDLNQLSKDDSELSGRITTLQDSKETHSIEMPTNADGTNSNSGSRSEIESHTPTGYDTYDIVWRQYYSAIMRFQTPDPEIEDAYAESPYSMCDNNMVLRTDPDGRFWANVGGALLSGGLDYAGQVAGNLATGHSLRSALTENISVGSIVVSAVEGAINPIGGVSKAAAKAVAESTIKTIVKTTLKEAGKAAAGQALDNVIAGDKLSKGVVSSAVIGGVTGHLKFSPNSPKANQTTRELTAAHKNGKKLSVKQTERLAQAKTERLGNEIIKKTTDYVAGSNNKIITNITDDKKKK